MATRQMRTILVVLIVALGAGSAASGASRAATSAAKASQQTAKRYTHFRIASGVRCVYERKRGGAITCRNARSASARLGQTGLASLVSNGFSSLPRPLGPYLRKGQTWTIGKLTCTVQGRTKLTTFIECRNKRTIIQVAPTGSSSGEVPTVTR